MSLVVCPAHPCAAEIASQPAPTAPAATMADGASTTVLAVEGAPTPYAKYGLN